MISVVIPTLDAEAGLPAALAALVPAAVNGVVREVIIADGGSTDRTRMIAEDAGAEFVEGARGRGAQLAAGAAKARSSWLLFLHADTVLDATWEREAQAFMARVDKGTTAPAAAAFRFALDDRGLRPRVLELLVRSRCAVLRLPYGDQGLLLPRSLYDAVGGYRPLPLMEDVDIVRRLGRRRIRLLPAAAVTSAVRYRRDGYAARAGRNLVCLALYSVNAPMPLIARLYGAGGAKSPPRE